LFAARLCNELRYYLSSRKVNNFDKLCDLLVSDKLKSCLSVGTLSYVLSLEGNGCFEPDEIAELADTYTNCHMGSTYGSIRSDRTEVSGVGININLRDHFMELKEGSPILLLLVRVGHSARVVLLDVAGGVSQRITSLRTALRVGRPGRLPVTATERR